MEDDSRIQGTRPFEGRHSRSNTLLFLVSSYNVLILRPVGDSDEIFSVLVCSITEIIQFRSTSALEANVLQAIGNPSFLCILGSRLLFNLKEAAELGLNKGTNFRVDTWSVSGLRFTGHDNEGIVVHCVSARCMEL